MHASPLAHRTACTPCARSTQQPPPPAPQQTHGGIGASPNRPSTRTKAWARSVAWLRTGLHMLLLWLGLGLGAAWADELVTPVSWHATFPVLMFDVEASQPLTVTGLSTGVRDSGSAATFEVWTRPGTHVGHSSSASDWTSLGTTAPMAVTDYSVVSLPLTLAVRLAAGDVQAFMIRRTDGLNLGYSNGSGSVGDPVAADSHLRILSGTSALLDLSYNYSPRNLVGAVRYQPVAISTASLPTGTVGVPYTQALAAWGGTGNLSWSATGLPDGLDIDPLTGEITGTPSTPTPVATTDNVAVTVSDSSTPTPKTDTRTFTLTVAPAPLAISTSSTLPNAAVGQPYSQQLTASGGLQPLSWSATGLPAGLNIDPASGEISGTPTDVKAMAAKATPLNVVVTVLDSSSPQLQATQTFTLTVAAAAQATPTPVPTLGEWALGLLALLTAAAGALRSRARHGV